MRRAASRFGAVVLLKGADTLVAAPRTGVLVATYGTPALATAGSGDVLTGVVAAFLAKGMEAQYAAAAAAVAHGVAAELVDPQAGAVASDLLPELRRALGGHGLQRAPLASRDAQRESRSTSARFAATRRRSLRALDGAELWAVVKADGYGHGAADCAAAALDAGATALCVATVAEALALRRDAAATRASSSSGPSRPPRSPPHARRGSS